MNDHQCRDFVANFAAGIPAGMDTTHRARDTGLVFVNGGEWSLTEFGRSFLPAGPDSDSSQCPDDDSYLPQINKAQAHNTLNQTARNILDNLRVIGPGLVQQPTAKDTQIGGDHYKKLGAYQPWEVLAVWLTPEELRGYMKGTVIAYLAREQDKGGDADIAKALHTMQLWQEVRKDK